MRLLIITYYMILFASVCNMFKQWYSNIFGQGSAVVGNNNILKN